MTDPHRITSLEELEALYTDAPSPLALAKELDHISTHYRRFIEASPFVTVSTVGPQGLDTSPRGDPAGFVRVADEKTLLLPDRRGNNRLDTLGNLVRDPRISLLFLIPGVGETIRVKGHAEITTDPALCETFVINGKKPRSIIRVHAERVFFQCQKAIKRSRLWQAEARVERETLPSTGTMLADAVDGFDGTHYDATYPAHMKKTIY